MLCGKPQLFQQSHGSDHIERSPNEDLQNSIDRVTIAEDQDYHHVVRAELASDNSNVVKTV
jgi:hypothetical protein